MAVRDCATVEEFRRAVWQQFTVSADFITPIPGDTLTFRGETIRYMPPPKEIEPEEIACATLEEYGEACRKYRATAIWTNPSPAGMATTGYVRIVYRPPPPKDEAREAFEAWYALGTRGPLGPVPVGIPESCLLAAFRAGRASVKP